MAARSWLSRAWTFASMFAWRSCLCLSISESFPWIWSICWFFSCRRASDSFFTSARSFPSAVMAVVSWRAAWDSPRWKRKYSTARPAARATMAPTLTRTGKRTPCFAAFTTNISGLTFILLLVATFSISRRISCCSSREIPESASNANSSRPSVPRPRVSLSLRALFRSPSIDDSLPSEYRHLWVITSTPSHPSGGGFLSYFRVRSRSIDETLSPGMTFKASRKYSAALEKFLS